MFFLIAKIRRNVYLSRLLGSIPPPRPAGL